MDTNDGGSAFPLPAGGTISDGMTLRDYFIANAPAEPWPHFEPVMATERPTPQWESEDGRVFLNALEAEKAVGDDMYRNTNDQAARQWDSDKARQRRIQWPIFWAITMLAERNKLYV